MSYIIGTAGHVDHGKTTLTKLLTNIDTDRLAEEKKRGLSIELGFAYFDIENLGRVGVIDVPGHEKFLSNMLKGVSSFDLVLFCVALDDSIMPQTIDHFNIIKLLNIENVIFLLTKKDLVDEDRVKVVKKDLEELRKNTIYKNARVMEISHDSEESIAELKKEIEKILKISNKHCTSLKCRLPIDRVFSIKGQGTVATGTLLEGEINKDEKLYLYGKNSEVFIRSIERHGADVWEIEKGNRCALNVKTTHNESIEKGDLIINKYLHEKLKDISCKNDIDVHIEFIDKENSIDTKIKKRQNITLYFQTLKRKAILTLQSLKESEGKYYGKIKINGPLPLFLREDILILRDNGTGSILGSAKVLMNNIETLHTEKIKNIDYKKLLNKESLFNYILKQNLYLYENEMLFLLNVDSLESYDFVRLDDFTLLETTYDELKINVIKKVKEFNDKNKEVKGIKAEALLKELSLKEKDFLFLNSFINKLETEKILVRNESFISIFGLSKTISEEDEKIVKDINKLFTLNNEIVYIKEEEVFKLPYSKDKLKKIIAYMSDNEGLFRITRTSFINNELFNKARTFTVNFITKNDSIEVKDLRDELQIGRKVSIEILEYFDKIGLTIRKDNKRVLRK